MKDCIAFAGVGRMGANMARCLKDKKFDVTGVYDVHRESAQSLAAEIGAQACESLAALAAGADIVITVVTDDAAQRAVFTVPGDNLLANAAGKLFINCATISPAVHVEVEKLAEAVGASSLEACMASSIPQAREGKLYLLCGGREAVFQRAKPVLEALSETLLYVGETGRAGQVKALVNMVMNSNTAALAEGLGLGAALGLDLTVLMEVFSQTGANSRVLATDGEDMVKRDHACFFSAAHAAKDSGIALSLARDVGLELPVAAAAKGQFDRMVAGGLGALDKSGVAELTFPGRHERQAGA